MPLPIAYFAVAGLAAYGYKKYNEYSESKEREAKREEEEDKREELLTLIENLPGFVAIMYAFSNVDGIDERESKEIADFIKNFQKKIDSSDDRKLIAKLMKKNKALDDLLNKQSTIKLSEALKYIHLPTRYNSNYRKVKEQLKELSESIIYADSHCSDEEKELVERLKLYLDNGSDSIKEIEVLEKKDNLIKNYFLIDNELDKKDTYKIENTQIITQEDKTFDNLSYLPLNNYFIVHPMNRKKLISPNDIINIERLITEEWQTIAGMLGAKSIEIKNTEDYVEKSKEETAANVDVNVQQYGSGNAGGGVGNANATSSKNVEHFKRTFKTGNKEERSIVEGKITWLKYNSSISGLIENVYSSNPPKKYEFLISGEEYLSRNSHINFEASINLLEKVGVSAKIDNVEKYSNFKKYKKLFKITF